MTKITYIEHSGTEHTVDVEPGLSVMQGAVNKGLPGIIGDCGGVMSCATCHVYVDPAWTDRVNQKSEMEEEMLEEVCDPQENSRLSCQINVSDELEGLIVRMPASQV